MVVVEFVATMMWSRENCPADPEKREHARVLLGNEKLKYEKVTVAPVVEKMAPSEELVTSLCT